VGDTLELIPTFDKGKAACDFYVYDDENNADNYGMDSVRCDGNMLYAQAPGSATLRMDVDGDEHSEYRVIVSDGDKAIRLVHPEGPLGVQKTFQLKVEDRTGKEYPAVFSQQQGTEGIAIVSENGLMTGVAPGEFILYATLEDGRKLQYRQKVLQVPEWLQHDDAMACINWQDARLMPIQSDVGIIPADQVNVTVADESIATYNSAFRFHKEGTTTVTLTSKYSDASTTFTLTVLPPDGTLYTDETWLKVPMDSFVYLPEVRDYYGNKVEVTWEITYHVAGSGNPNSTAFRLTPTRIFCSWPYGLCEITGTAQDGRYIVLTASGYRMAKSIQFRQSTQEIYVGEQAQLQLTISEMGYELGPVTWKVGDSSILQFAEKDPATGETAVTGLKAGTTTVKATLQNGTTATCTITVKPPVPVEAFYFEPAEVTIYEGVDYYFIPLHEPKNTTESLLKTWSTSNPEVATIEQGTARLRGVKPGEAVITATLESGKSASLKVKVVGKKALYLPYDLTAVEEEAFAGGGFTHVYCRTGLVSIGSRAFADCKDLKCIWIPDSVKFISPDAFAGCSDVKIMCRADSYAYRFAQSHYMLWELTSRFD